MKRVEMLTKNQKEFILKFFKNDEIPGWRNIATHLIEKGTVLTSCVHTDIWWGGIGNFITSEESDEGVGVWKYTFDLNDFMYSNMFIEHHQKRLNELEKEYIRVKEEYEELKFIRISISI